MSTKTPVNPVTLCAMGTDGKLYPVLLDPASQSLKVDATLQVQDIEIGGVEIKNGTDDTRATVLDGDIAPATTDNALVAAVADGKDVSQGAVGDTPWSGSGSGTLIAVAKAIYAAAEAIVAALAGTLTVATHAVTQSGAWVLSAGSAIIGKVDHSTTGIAHGDKTVTTAGTPVQLKSAATPAKWVWIYAYASNTGKIAIGGSGVNASATAGTGTGGALGAGESIMLPCADLSDFYIDATVSGEGVRFTYGT